MRRSVILVAGLLALSACGGEGAAPTAMHTSAAVDLTAAIPSTSGAGGAGIDPCLLLTAADLETITGLPFSEGAYNDSLSHDELWICDWAASGTQFATAQVLIVPLADAFAGNRGSAGDALGGVEDLEVAGAEEAYTTSDGSIVGMLVEDRFVQVAFFGSPADDAASATAAIAAVVAGNLTT